MADLKANAMMMAAGEIAAERDDLRCRAEAAEAEVARLRAELATARAYGWRSAIEASSGRLLSFAEKMKDRDDEPSIHIRAAAAAELKSMGARMERLGTEFEAPIFDNLEDLYDNSPLDDAAKGGDA
jgi:hypothetical protein